jgi:hypothetical protein
MQDLEKLNKLEARDIGAMPGYGSGNVGAKQKLDKYAVRYLKVDIDDAAGVLELSSIETRALHANEKDPEVVLIDKDKFTFMDKYFLILKYLEKN